MRALNPDQLRTFIEVVELGSFTAAAKRLHLSQPAVSLQIRELEGRCGVRLLERNGRKPHASEAGRRLLVHAQRILKENEEALVAMRHLRERTGQQVRVGMTMTTLSYLARDVVRRFKVENPKIDLTIELSSTAAMGDDVRAGHLDLAIVSLPVEETKLTVEPFYADSVNGIVPDGYFTPAPRVATPELLASAPFVTQAIGDVQTILAQNWFRASGQAPHSFVEVRNLEACRAAVAAGLGVSIIPGMMARLPMSGLLVLPLDPPVTRQVALISLQDRKPSSYVEQVRVALLQCRDVTKDEPLSAGPKLVAERRMRG